MGPSATAFDSGFAGDGDGVTAGGGAGLPAADCGETGDGLSAGGRGESGAAALGAGTRLSSGGSDCTCGGR